MELSQVSEFPLQTIQPANPKHRITKTSQNSELWGKSENSEYNVVSIQRLKSKFRKKVRNLRGKLLILRLKSEFLEKSEFWKKFWQKILNSEIIVMILREKSGFLSLFLQWQNWPWPFFLQRMQHLVVVPLVLGSQGFQGFLEVLMGFSDVLDVSERSIHKCGFVLTVRLHSFPGRRPASGAACLELVYRRWGWRVPPASSFTFVGFMHVLHSARLTDGEGEFHWFKFVC